MLNRKVALLGAFCAVLILSVCAFSVCYESDAGTAPSSGSGTETDPYVYNLTKGTETTVKIDSLGPFTKFYAIGSDMTIPGMTLSYGYWTDTTLPVSGHQEQLDSFDIEGTPTATGSWSMYGYYSGTGSTYYKINVVSSSSSVTKEWKFYDTDGLTVIKTMNVTFASYPTYVTLPSINSQITGTAILEWTGTGYWNAGSYNAGSSIAVGQTGARDSSFYASKTVSAAPTTYTVDFNSNGGSGSISEMTVTSGSSVYLPTQGFTKDGYYLTGWKANNSGSSLSPGSSYKPTSNVTMYAVWTALSSTYKFDDTAPSTVEIGETYSYKPYDSIYSIQDDAWDYFAVYYLESQYTIVVDEMPSWLSYSESSKKITFTGTPATAGNYIVKLHLKNMYGSGIGGTYVSWTINVPSLTDRQYTLTYNSNGGSQITGTSSYQVTYGSSVVLLGAGLTSKTGKTQAGWEITTQNGTSVYPFGSLFTVTADTVAKAKWISDTYVLIFNASGASGVTAYAVQDGSIATLSADPQYSKPGYTFRGWYQDGMPQRIYAPGYAMDINGPTQMIAYWIANSSANTVEVKFDSNGGSGSTFTQYVEKSSGVALPKYGYSKDGYTFKGWSTSKTGGTIYGPGNTYTVNSSVTFYAQYQQNEITPSTHSVTFLVYGDNGVLKTVSHGSPVQKPTDPQRTDGYAFLGWKKTDSSYWDFSTPVTSDMTLEAQWEKLFDVSKTEATITLTMVQKYSVNTVTVNWGDGTTDGLKTHTYTQSMDGIIAMTLKVDNTTNLTASVSFNVYVSDGGYGGDDPEEPDEPEDNPVIPTVKLTHTVNGKVHTFDATGSTNYQTIYWTVNGQYYGNALKLNIDSSNLSSGSYTVVLKLTSSTNNVKTASESFTVSDASTPTADDKTEDSTDTENPYTLVFLAIVCLIVFVLAVRFL